MGGYCRTTIGITRAVLRRVGVFCAVVGVVAGGVRIADGGGPAVLPTMAALWRGHAGTSSDGVSVTGASAEELAAVREAITALTIPTDPGWLEFRVVDAVREVPGALGLYDGAAGVVELERSTVARGGRELTRVVAHELGHDFDARFMNDSARTGVAIARGYPEDVDWGGQALPWEDRPQEDFAEVFAALSVPGAGRRVTTSYGPIEATGDLLALLESRAPPGSGRGGAPAAATAARLFVGDVVQEPFDARALAFGGAVFVLDGALAAGWRSRRHRRVRRRPRRRAVLVVTASAGSQPSRAA